MGTFRKVCVSDKKARETDKIKFFEVGTEGEIRPAFPKESTVVTPLDVRVGSSQSLISDKLSELKSQIESLSEDAKGLSGEESGILKRYIALKEAEVDDLRASHRQYQDHLSQLTSELALLSEKNRELVRECESRKGSQEAASLQVAQIRAEMEEKIARFEEDQHARIRVRENMERELMELERQKQEWKSSVADDLRRIRLKERELETKHELLKRDSQALLDSKDKHLIELKRKCDAFELEMETLEQRLRSQSTGLANVEARKKRLVETLRLAMALLEGIDRPEP